MRSFSVVALLLLCGISGFAGQTVQSRSNPVVTIQPPCVEWSTPPGGGRPAARAIKIRYDPHAPGAGLTSPRSLTLVLAGAHVPQYEVRTIPMTKAGDCTWHAEFTSEHAYFPGYAILLFKDEHNHIDNNHRKYWDILNCHSEYPDGSSVAEQARTYTGRLIAPGFERPPDLPHAIKILKDALKRNPDAYQLYFPLWDIELRLGGETPSAYKQVGDEIKDFLRDHGTEGEALLQVSGFIGPRQKELPPVVVQQYRQAATSLPQNAKPILYGGGRIYHVTRDEAFISRMQRLSTQILAELDYWPIEFEQADLPNKARDYFAFAAKYPQSFRAHEAYSDAFNCEKQSNDLTGAEKIFEEWSRFMPDSPRPLVAMAQLYVEAKTKPGVAVTLLDKAAAIFSSNQAGAHPHYFRRPGQIESLRGQANLMLNNLPAAHADLEAAAKAAPDDSSVLYALGQVCERMKDPSSALEAYLSAASVPYPKSAAPREAYERLFIAQKLGTAQDADRRISARITENTRRAAAAYTPMPYGIPAPRFSFTDLAGNAFDNQVAKGKPTLVTFWSPG